MNGLVLQLQYLTGRAIASAYNDRDRAEWPLHPARLYSALVATWADSEEQDAAEQAALEWLAEQQPPSIYASDASHRHVVPHFVPVNDVGVLNTFARQRSRQEDFLRTLGMAEAEHEAAQAAGDAKRIGRAGKSLAQAQKKHGTGQQKLDQLLVEDQQPCRPGKHSGTGMKSAVALIPEHRGKQPRAVPSVSPDDPRVFVRWSASAAEVLQHKAALAQLASRVVRVGHSASLVSCALADDCPDPTWEPSDSGDEVLRVPGPGQFAQLREAFERHREVDPRVLPCRFQRYRRTGDVQLLTSGASCFGEDWIVFRQISGRRLSQICCVAVAQAMRGALLKHADDPSPELLSGHAKNGQPSEIPHLAVVPLPFVGNPHATGELLGLALVFPRTADEADRKAVLRAIGTWENERRTAEDDELVDTPPLKLTMGHSGAIEVERVEWGLAPLKTLRPATWSRGARAWVTATPIALDRNPGDLFSREPGKAEAAYSAAEESIALACERIGLPAPNYVQVHPSVPLSGATKARAYPAFPVDPKKNQRVKVHARIEFPVRVTGPVLLGAGRYHGLGLCFPLPSEHRTR